HLPSGPFQVVVSPFLYKEPPFYIALSSCHLAPCLPLPCLLLCLGDPISHSLGGIRLQDNLRG
ncbi:MAG: hypothetical protein WCJ37_12775, partial [Syntrophus sp. (in: bacteria)]